MGGGEDAVRVRLVGLAEPVKQHESNFYHRLGRQSVGRGRRACHRTKKTPKKLTMILDVAYSGLFDS